MGGLISPRLKRVYIAALFTVMMILILLFLAPGRAVMGAIPENGGNPAVPPSAELGSKVNEPVFMAIAFALLAGGMLYIASRWITSPVALWFLATAILAGMAVRTLSLGQWLNGDYYWCLRPWAQHFRLNGFRGIINTRSNYNVPYLYFVAIMARIPMNDLYLYKLLSVLFDCGVMLAGLRLATTLKLSDAKRAVTAAGLILAPTIWLNSAFWAQCDAIYAFFCLLALALALENRPVLAVAMAAVGFSFKMQAVFLLPVFAVLLIAKKVRWRDVPVFIGAFFATLLPAVIAGRPLSDILNILVHQTEEYSSRLNLSSPSMYALLPTGDKSDVAGKFKDFHDILFNSGIILAFCFVGALILLAWRYREKLTNTALVLFAAAMVIGIPWFLPSMHERYFFLADVFCVIVAVMKPKYWYFAPLCVYCSYSGYQEYLFGIPSSLEISALIMLFLLGSALMLLARELRRPDESRAAALLVSP